MNLQEFVKNVLVEIDAAVDSARSATSRDIRFAGDDNKRTIEFDIAVSVEEEASKSGKAGIRVLEFAEAGGDISATNKNATVSRITFGLHITPLTRAEDEELTARVRAHNTNLRSGL